MSTFQPSFTLNQYIHAVRVVCYVSRQSGADTPIGNFVRVHLAQTVLLRFDPVGMEKLLLHGSPREVLLSIDQRLGNRERVVRYLSIGRWTTCLYGISQRPESTLSADELIHDGCHAYRLAADCAASYDHDYANLWWKIADRFPTYGEIVDAACQLLTA